MNVYCLVTPSHQGLLRNWFLRTLPAECEPRPHWVSADPQEFAQGRWHRVVAQKFDVLERAFGCEPEDGVFVLSDVDIRFYRPFAADLLGRMRGLDVLFQHNRPSLPKIPAHLCTGFVAIRNNPPGRAFFRRAQRRLAACNRPETGDQKACIDVLHRYPESLRFGFLPVSYWSPGSELGRWLPGRPLAPPPGMVLHHANHTVGIVNKIEQLRTVEAQWAGLPPASAVPAAQPT